MHTLHPRHLFWAVCAAGLIALAATPRPAQSAPEPRLINESWQIELTFKAPRALAITQPDGTRAYYWYLPYTVTNNTGEDRLFVPKFTILTDQGNLIDAGRKIDPTVFDKVKAQQDNDLLESPVQVIGRLLQGEDNARDSVAIWRAPEADVDRMWVFVSGLSGETAVVQNPIVQDDPNTEAIEGRVILRKTLMLEFQTPGTIEQINGKPVRTIDQQWVMR